MNMDAAIRLKAKVEGQNAIQAFGRDLKGLDGAAKLSGAELGRMNIAISRMAREAGNTTAGLKQHISALSSLRDRVEIGGKAYNRLGGEIDALRGKLRALDKDAEKTGSTLKDQLVGGLATAGLGRMTAGIIQNAAGLDAEVRKASAIEGGGNYDTLRKSIEEVAAVAAGTPTQVAQLATALSRAGFTATETSQALSGIVLGAEAASVSFEEMGSITADAMRAFGIETSKTTQVVDILVKAANSSNQTVLDLGESLKYAAPIARSLGVNINDLSATMAILANNGIRGSEAGTALRTGLGRLQLAASGSQDQLLELTRGSGLLADAMKTLGANVLDANGNLKPLDQVLIGLKQNLENMPKGVQVEVMKALFGDEAGGKLRAALNSSEADIRKMFAAIRESGGATETTHEQMRGFSYTMTVLTGNIETVANAIGDKFIAVLDPLAKGAIAVLDVMLKLPQPVKDFAAALAATGIAAAGVGLAIKTIGGLSTVVSIVQGMAGALNVAKAAQLGFNLAVLANPYVAAAAGIVALTVAAYNMSKPFKEFVDSIPQRIGIFWDSLTNDALASVNAVKGAWDGFAGWFGGLWQGISKWFSDTWAGIKKTVKDALGAIGIDAGWLAGAFGKVANEIEYLWNQAFYFIQKNWQSAVAGMVNASSPLFFALKKLGVVDVGGATAKALFGQLPPAPTRRQTSTSNVIPPAPTGGGDGTLPAGLGGSSSSTKAKEKSLAAEIASALKGALSLTDAQAAGIVGNFMRESGLNPRVNEGGIVGLPRGVGGYGLAQWTGSRQTDLINFAGGAAQAGDLGAQLRFVVKELLGPESRALESLRRAQTPDEAAFVFDRDYERSGVKAMSERQANARRVFAELAGKGIGSGLGDFAKDLEAQAKALEDATAYTKELGDANVDLADKIKAVGATGVEALQNQHSDALKQITRDTDAATAKVQQLWKASGGTLNVKPLEGLIARNAELKKGLADTQLTDGLKGLLPSLKDYDRQLAENKKLLDNRKQGIREMTEAQKLDTQIQMLGLDVIALTNPQLAEQIRLLRERASAVDASRAALEETSFADAIRDKVQNYINSIKDVGSAIGDVVVNAFQGMEGALTEFVMTGKASFKDLARSIIEDIVRITIRAAIIKPILGALGGPSGLFPNLFQFAEGGVMTGDGPVPLRTYARGGVANSPQLAMFGEGSQPEAFVPLPDGRRIPVAIQGGSGGGNATVNVSVDARGSNVEGNSGQSERLGRVIAQAVQQELIRQKRPGGLLTAAA